MASLLITNHDARPHLRLSWAQYKVGVLQCLLTSQYYHPQSLSLLIIISLLANLQSRGGSKRWQLNAICEWEEQLMTLTAPLGMPRHLAPYRASPCLDEVITMPQHCMGFAQQVLGVQWPTLTQFLNVPCSQPQKCWKWKGYWLIAKPDSVI